MKFLDKFEPLTKGPRLLPLEGMRGFAALLVFFVHFEALFKRHINTNSILDPAFQIAGSFGHTGVDLFFVLSGYLIYQIVFKQPGFIRYLQRRIQRLYPVFLAVMLIYVGLSLVFPEYSRIPAALPAAVSYLGANLLMLPGITPIVPLITVAWSLSYEWFFYILAPLAVNALGLRRWRCLHRVGFFFLAAAAQIYLCSIGWENHSRLIMFVAGMILWEVTAHYRIAARLPAWGEYIVAAVFCVNLVLIGIAGSRTGPATIILKSVPMYYSTALFITMFFLALYGLFYDGALQKLFSSPWLRFLGNISYSYYLIHGLTLHALRTVFPFAMPTSAAGLLALCAVCLAATLVSASALFLCVEKPLSWPRPAVRMRLSRSETPVGVLQ